MKDSKAVDRLLMLLPPIGTALAILWYVGVFKGETTTKLASHDAEIASLTSLMAIDHDKLTTIGQRIEDIHNYFSAQGVFGTRQQSTATVPADTAAVPVPAATLPATVAPVLRKPALSR